MTQVSTRRFLFRTAPGHIYTPAQERETESMCSPFVIQQQTITLAGADPFAAPATLTMTFLVPSTGQNGSFQVAIPNATTLAQAAALLAAAWNADPIASQLYTATSALAVVTLVARSANVNIPAASITGVFSDAHTATVAQTVAPSAPSIQMGLFYVYAPVVVPLAISGTPRGATPAALPTGTTTIADLRGVVGRVVNQTTLSPTFNSTTSDDAYPAGQVWPGLLRGEICTRVDPASAAITPGGQVHVVIAAGAYSIVGAVAAAADGANTIQVNNAPAGNILVRAIAIEETLQVFGTSTVGRYVNLKVNRTN